jgi:ribosomal protein L37AE/L43A
MVKARRPTSDPAPIHGRFGTRSLARQARAVHGALSVTRSTKACTFFGRLARIARNSSGVSMGAAALWCFPKVAPPHGGRAHRRRELREPVAVFSLAFNELSRSIGRLQPFHAQWCKATPHRGRPRAWLRDAVEPTLPGVPHGAGIGKESSVEHDHLVRAKRISLQLVRVTLCLLPCERRAPFPSSRLGC